MGRFHSKVSVFFLLLCACISSGQTTDASKTDKKVKREKVKKVYTPSVNSTTVLNSISSYPLEKQPVIKNMIAFHQKLTAVADSKVKSKFGSKADIQKNYNHLMGYLDVSMKYKPKIVCEIGFEAGHYASTFLFGSPGATYVGFEPLTPGRTFNQGNRSYSLPCFELFETTFPVKDGKKHQLVLGPSDQTVPAFVADLKSKADKFKCDLIHIDGEHFGEAPMKDMLTMASLAKEDGSTVVVADSSICEERHNHSVCAMPQMAWKSMMKTNVTKSIECVQYSRNRGYCVGQYAGDALAHVEEARALIVKRMNAMKPIPMNFTVVSKGSKDSKPKRKLVRKEGKGAKSEVSF